MYITNAINGAGGLERVLSIKASYLADNLGYDVNILVLNAIGELNFYEFSTKIKVHSISVSGNPIKYIFNYISGIRKEVKTIKPDLILVCDDGLKGFFVPQFISKKYRIIYERHVSKNISIAQESTFFKTINQKLQFKIMDYLAKSFDKFVVLTIKNLNEWQNKNAIVIANPLSFYSNESSNLQNKKVIAVGKQSYQKGYDRLLKAWQIVNKSYPNWELEIYGAFDKNEKLNELAENLKIANAVHFFEPLKDIQNKYLQSSIFVLSSRFEGFGMVLIEAMACGVPCVSFDCPYGPSDIISDNEDGFLVENGNYQEMANKIIYLVENDKKRIQFGKNAKCNVKRYLPETVLNQWDNLFKDLVK